MKQNVQFKALVVAGLGLAFLVPLALIVGVVAERAGTQAGVVREVAGSTARAQDLVGPLLVVRYREVVTAPGAKAPTVLDRVEILTPDTLDIDTRVNVEERRRGIYRVPVYRAANRIAATFEVPERYGIAADRSLAGEPEVELVFGVADRRGLRAAPELRVDGETLETRPGRALAWLGDGIAAQLPGGAKGAVAVELDLDVMGTERLTFVPVGATTTAAMTSDWPHPGFVGGFLPDAHQVRRDGFQATWRLSRFATGVEDAIARAGQGDAPGLARNDVGVRFVQPVNVYQQSERAVKYGILFVLLTFASFFLYEVLRRMAIHPIQYTLCGGGLALFFLLLVSLSEHLPFGAAYLIASGACAGLLAFYVGHVLRRAAHGLAFGAQIAGLYGVLYVLLRLEDYALLVGSLILFAALATIMFVTRRVDWYRLQEESAARA